MPTKGYDFWQILGFDCPNTWQFGHISSQLNNILDRGIFYGHMIILIRNVKWFMHFLLISQSMSLSFWMWYRIMFSLIIIRRSSCWINFGLIRFGFPCSIWNHDGEFLIIVSFNLYKILSIFKLMWCLVQHKVWINMKYYDNKQD